MATSSYHEIARALWCCHTQSLPFMKKKNFMVSKLFYLHSLLRILSQMKHKNAFGLKDCVQYPVYMYFITTWRKSGQYIYTNLNILNMYILRSQFPDPSLWNVSCASPTPAALTPGREVGGVAGQHPYKKFYPSLWSVGDRWKSPQLFMLKSLCRPVLATLVV